MIKDTPKALANCSPGLDAQRQPWEQNKKDQKR